jgi:hypothetical protein
MAAVWCEFIMVWAVIAVFWLIMVYYVLCNRCLRSPLRYFIELPVDSEILRLFGKEKLKLLLTSLVKSGINW